MIRVKNVYYMLAYAFRALESRGYADLATEDFENAADLLAAILARGINMQVRRGLAHTYTEADEVTPSPRGKVDVATTVKSATLSTRRVACTHDEFTPNAYLNRIVKTAGSLLLHEPLKASRARDLRRALAYLDGVDRLDPRRIDWRQRYDRGTATYRMLVGVCQMAVEGALQSSEAGDTRLERFSDGRQMSALYEHFLLEYFRREHADTLSAGAPYIPWALDGSETGVLPVMRTDVTLRGKGAISDRTLIIDAKYYSHNTQQHFDKRTIHSGNLYQMFTYVKNEEYRLARLGMPHEVSGLVLYARTTDEVQPEGRWSMDGNSIGVGTVDLGAEFAEIRKALDGIVVRYFGADKSGAPVTGEVSSGSR